MTIEAVLCDEDIHVRPRVHSFSTAPKLVLMGVVIQKGVVFTLAHGFSIWGSGLLCDLNSLTYYIFKTDFFFLVWLVLFPYDGMKTSKSA